MATDLSKLTISLRKSATTPSKGEGHYLGHLRAGGGIYLKVRQGKRGLNQAWRVVFWFNGKTIRRYIGTLEKVPTEREAKDIAQHKLKRFKESNGQIDFDAVDEVVEAPRTINELTAQWLDVLSAKKGRAGADYVRRFKGLFENHILPLLGTKTAPEISSADVADRLRSIQTETSKATALKAKTALTKFLDWCISEHLRESPNPAKGESLEPYLDPLPDDAEKQPALPYEQVPRFIAALTTKESMKAGSTLGLLFAILNCGRASMVRGVRNKSHGLLWREIETDAKTGARILHLKAYRMKVPKNGDFYAQLSRQSCALLDLMKSKHPGTADDPEGIVFPSPRGAFLNENAMNNRVKALDKLDRKNGGPGFRDLEQTIKDEEGKDVHKIATQHGISRATFGTWARAMNPDLNSDIVEMCLHHKSNDPYNGAYDRQREQRFLDLRGKLLQQWADYCFRDCPKSEINP